MKNYLQTTILGSSWTVATSNQVFSLNSKRFHSKCSLIWQNCEFDAFSSCHSSSNLWLPQALSSHATAFCEGLVLQGPGLKWNALASWHLSILTIAWSPDQDILKYVYAHTHTHTPHLLCHSLLLISPLSGGFSNTNNYQSCWVRERHRHLLGMIYETSDILWRTETSGPQFPFL